MAFASALLSIATLAFSEPLQKPEVNEPARRRQRPTVVINVGTVDPCYEAVDAECDGVPDDVQNVSPYSATQLVDRARLGGRLDPAVRTGDLTGVVASGDPIEVEFPTTVVESNETTLYRISRDGTVDTILRTSDEVAGNPGARFLTVSGPSVTSFGELAFLATTAHEAEDGAAVLRSGVYVASPDGSVRTVAVEGEGAPGGLLYETIAGLPTMAEGEVVGFGATLTDESGNSRFALLVSEGDEVTVRAIEGQAVSGITGAVLAPAIEAVGVSEEGPFAVAGPSFRGAINADGDLAFRSRLTAPDGTATELRTDTALLLSTRSGVRVLAREGDSVPAFGERRLADFQDASQLVINENGDVGTPVGLEGTVPSSALVVFATDGTITTLAEEGETASADLNAVFGRFTRDPLAVLQVGSPPADLQLTLNDTGQIAFVTEILLTRDVLEDEGPHFGLDALFAVDADGTRTLLYHEGGLLRSPGFGDREIVSLFVAQQALTDAGLLTFGASFTDGTEGIFTVNPFAEVPIPASALLLAPVFGFGGIARARARRRRRVGARR